MNFTISVILPNFNGKELLAAYLPHTFEALKNAQCPYEVILVDDSSTDQSVDFIEKNYPEIILLKNLENKGFSNSCNIGIQAAKNDLVLLLNTDIKLSPDYLLHLLPYFKEEHTFGVMGKIMDQSGKYLEIAAKIPSFKKFKLKVSKQVHPKKENTKFFPTTFLSGANCLISRDKLVKLDGFDEIYSPFYSEDLDLSIRAWKLGWKCYYDHQATSYHLGSHTTKSYFQKSKIKEIYFRNRMIFHAIHLHRKDLKRWNLHLLFFEVLPKVLIGQFWILRAFNGYKSQQKAIRNSRKKIRHLMMRNFGRKSIEDVTREIHAMLQVRDFVKL